jgi:RNA-directed DNA polymerase
MKVRYGAGPSESLRPRVMRVGPLGPARSVDRGTGRPAMEPRNQLSGMPTLFSQAEGNTTQDDRREPCADPARSKTLSMSGSLLPRNWEIRRPTTGARRSGPHREGEEP